MRSGSRLGARMGLELAGFVKLRGRAFPGKRFSRTAVTGGRMLVLSRSGSGEGAQRMIAA